MLVEAAVAKARTAVTTVPVRVRGRQSTPQNSASNMYHGAPSVLSAISSGAIGSSTMAAASRPRSVTDWMCPALAWKT